MRRPFIPAAAFVIGTVLMAGVYLGALTLLEGGSYAVFQFGRDQRYVLPIIVAFGIQAALYSIMRFRLYAPATPTAASGLMMGTSGGTSATAMVACCLHHAVNVLPVLGISAAAAFLARYQRPFMQVGLAMNLAGIIFMVATLQSARQQLRLSVDTQ
ncbi:MAG TPA: hypothetical protein VIU38_09260 [Anaerolineales bacterium]